MEQQSYWVQTTDQQRLYVKTWGNANNPALVLVHGYPDNQEVWEPVIGHLVQDYWWCIKKYAKKKQVEF